MDLISVGEAGWWHPASIIFETGRKTAAAWRDAGPSRLLPNGEIRYHPFVSAKNGHQPA